MLKKAEAANEESPFGELTQRLVAGLLEENTINQADVEESTKKGKNKQTKNNKQSSKIEILVILVDSHDFRAFAEVVKVITKYRASKKEFSARGTGDF
jgi:hypothetical protein